MIWKLDLNLSTNSKTAISGNPQGPILLEWIKLIPAWISNYINYLVLGEINYPFPNLYDANVDDFNVHVITFPCWDLS